MKLRKINKNPIFRLNVIVSACLYVSVIHGAQSQTIPSPADVLRGIEQSRPELQKDERKRESVAPVVPVAPGEGLARLVEVRIDSPMFTDELRKYWEPFINKPVPPQKLAEFQAFAWEIFQSKGYLAYVTTMPQQTPEGAVLIVQVALPSIRKISVLTDDGESGKKYADEVVRRFRKIYPEGSRVDIQNLERQLSAASYDLPVDLDVNLRQVDAKSIDLTINLRTIDATPGKILGGFVQLNNYGLRDYGIGQVLGNIRIGGFTPFSELSLKTQQSDGIGYYRADYEAPIQGAGLHWRAYMTRFEAEAKNVRAQSTEAGAGLVKLLRVDRFSKTYVSADLSRRDAGLSSSGLDISDRIDHQLRLKARYEGDSGPESQFSSEISLVSGHINLGRNPDDASFDASNLKIAGPYQKLEFNGVFSKALDKSQRYTGSMRWRTQYAFKNMDAYNRITMGGISGIRALTVADGAGDIGGQVSFDLVYTVRPGLWTGLFYDVGVVKQNRNPLASDPEQGFYTLQGAGAQIGGKFRELGWTLSVGQSFGDTPANWNTANIRIGSLRANAALTYAF
jgi:hemolysin activation/secretion protein